ncbi:MAG: hypothetical protein CVT64_05245 [Actinobacteria bacterium HGW-Actinobacteria-4]|nr:MAG: hypothetical protein CVT64_05245 [Actinobacteria bacterium HGW-Actinobacteria-4]
MRPPHCDVCGADATSGGGGLVSFKPTTSDALWHQRAARGEIVGHPPNAAWLCDKHARVGSALAGTHTLSAGLAQIQAADAPPAPSTPVANTVAGSIEIGALERRLRDIFASVARSVGLADAPVTTADDRRWTPMDASEPPNCPFTDIFTRQATHGNRYLTLTFERAHWNPHEVARASVTLVAHGHGTDHDFRLSAATPDSGSLMVDSITTKGTVPDAVTALLIELGYAS